MPPKYGGMHSWKIGFNFFRIAWYPFRIAWYQTSEQRFLGNSGSIFQDGMVPNYGAKVSWKPRFDFLG